jgi:hypothetical protein
MGGLLVSLVLAPASASPSEALVSLAASVDHPDDPLLDDAKWLASEMSISVDEAYGRLQTQAPAGELEAALVEQYPDMFGGLWLDQGQEFGIRVGVVGNDPTGIVDLVEEAGLDSITTFVSSTYPYAELESWASALLASTDDDEAPPYDLTVDIPANQIIVIASSEADLEYMEASVGSLDADPTAFAYRQGELAEPNLDIYAGLAITTCTTGFSVRSTSSTATGVTTAGHCGPSQAYSGHTLTHVAERWQGSQDVQWHTIPLNDILRPWVFDGMAGGSTPYYRVVTGTLGRSGQPVGALVCGYGKISAYRCGRIVWKNYAPSYIPSAQSTFIVLHNDNGADIAEHGDSGGPWFSGGTAYGILVTTRGTTRSTWQSTTSLP